jgi:hypothetical protein
MRHLAHIAAFDPHTLDAKELPALVPDTAARVPRPIANIVKSDQIRLEPNPAALLLAPGQNRRRVFRFDRPRSGEALTKPGEVCALRHQITSLSTSITVSTSSSFRCGYIGKEKIRCALRSATGNCPSR